jgi:exosortase H (IPTLxxWG-CTERM-specific)
VVDPEPVEHALAPSVNALRVRFAIGFVLIAGVLFAVYTFPYAESGVSETFFTSYLSAYARLAGHVLAPFDPSIVVRGQDIVGRYSLRIVKNCDAMEVNILFVSAVLAFPLPLRHRVIGVCLGIPALVAVNVLRICALYFIGLRSPETFEFFHLEVWPFVLVATGVGAFLAWAEWARGREELAAHVAP